MPVDQKLKLYNGTPQNCAYILLSVEREAAPLPIVLKAIHHSQAVYAEHFELQYQRQIADKTLSKGDAYRTSIVCNKHIRTIYESVGADQERADLMGEAFPFPNLLVELCPNGTHAIGKLPYLEQFAEIQLFLGRTAAPEIAEYLSSIELDATLSSLDAECDQLERDIHALGYMENPDTIASAKKARESYAKVCILLAAEHAKGSALGGKLFDFILRQAKLRAEQNKNFLKNRKAAKSID